MTYNEKKSLYESIMKEVAKTVKRKINEAVIVDDCITDYYIDEDNDIKVEFSIKSISEEKSIFFFTAFAGSVMKNLDYLFFIGDIKISKEWINASDEDTLDRMDDMTEKIYKTCVEGTSNGYMLAKKLKKAAPSFGFEFTYKVIE